MTGIGKKLQLKPEQNILLIQAPAAFAAAMAAEGYTVATAATAAGDAAAYDAVQLFVQDSAALNALAPEAAAALRPGGVFWIAYPKKSSKVVPDLSRDEGWKTVANLGYAGVRQISIDETWSSVRFRHKDERTAPSKAGAVYPGIDKVARTVTPPADLQQALEEAGLTDHFNSFAFTHKKEYVAAVLDAKRPETREKRIAKTIEQLAASAEASV